MSRLIVEYLYGELEYNGEALDETLVVVVVLRGGVLGEGTPLISAEGVFIAEYIEVLRGDIAVAVLETLALETLLGDEVVRCVK